MREVKDRVTYCSICNSITDSDPCGLCSADDRDRRMICVVEDPQNVAAIEKTRGFRGLYHVLLGALSPLQGVGPDDLKIKGLIARVDPAASRRSSSRPIPMSRARRPPSTWRGCSSRSVSR